MGGVIAVGTEEPARYFLFHGPRFRLSALQPALEVERVTVLPADHLLCGSADCDGPAVLVVDGTLLEPPPKLELLPDHLAIVAGDAAAEHALGDDADLSLVAIREVEAKLSMLRAAFRLSAERLDRRHCQLELTRSRNELTELNRIGMALMLEHDPDTLLRRIVEQCIRLTGSDGGGLFLLEEHDGHARLRFKVLHSDSVPGVSMLMDETFPVDSTSLAGHVALTAEPLVVADVHNLAADASYALNPIAEHRLGVRLRSMLTIPMIDHRGDVVGVLQLANRKSDPAVRITSREDVEQHVIPYSDWDVRLGFSLAGQAAVSIENANLHAQIEQLFECFVRATVSAIDQRDPTTAGHSIRVTTLVIDLAAALERTATGTGRALRFTRSQMRELRYAALLHDCGKLGVSEDVLVKARKLPAFLWERVNARFDLIRCTIAFAHERNRARLLASKAISEERIAVLEAKRDEQLQQIDRFQSLVRAANEPVMVSDATARTLAELAAHTFTRPDGRIERYLTAEELHYLQIPNGSLDDRERLEMEQHAKHTYLFLSQIPWKDDCKDMAVHASAHHEKLDGTGYPRQLEGRDISIQTRMITIADI